MARELLWQRAVGRKNPKICAEIGAKWPRFDATASLICKVKPPHGATLPVTACKACKFDQRR